MHSLIHSWNKAAFAALSLAATVSFHQPVGAALNLTERPADTQLTLSQVEVEEKEPLTSGNQEYLESIFSGFTGYKTAKGCIFEKKSKYPADDPSEMLDVIDTMTVDLAASKFEIVRNVPKGKQTSSTHYVIRISGEDEHTAFEQKLLVDEKEEPINEDQRVKYGVIAGRANTACQTIIKFDF